MSKLYIADKPTLDKVLEKVDLVLGNLMALNDDETLKTKVAANYFNTRKTGKVFGVFFNKYSISSVSTGIRKFDAVGMIARPSTDSVAERNDFDEYAIFNGLTVNGHVDTNGDFVVEYFEGEEGFSKTTKDTYVLFGTSYVNISIDSTGETISLSDVERDGYFPMPGAVRPDGSIRPFIPIAKYYASSGTDGKVASLSGKEAYHNNASHNWCLTEFHKKGTQYCATTMQDRFLLETLFQVVFATRDTQSIMRGCTNYNYQPNVAKVESGATNRVLVTKGQGVNFIVGSKASVGTGTNKDRNVADSYKYANRRHVVKVEASITVDGTQYDAIYLDGDPFTLVGTSDFISTMPWDTGACDNVLGSCGSHVDNTTGRTPFIFFGVEMAIGLWEVMGNAIYKQESTDIKKGAVYICYDCANLATAPDTHYVKVGYNIAGGENAWKYISELGFDKQNPCARMATGLAATTTTGYADGQYTNNVANNYEVLVGGGLSNGDSAGFFCRSLGNALTGSAWNISARLSATGKCGVKAAA